MSSNLVLNCVPNNASVNITLSWTGAVPSGISEYCVFYYVTGLRQVKSSVSKNLSFVITGLTNATQYNFRAAAYINGSIQSGHKLSETALISNIIPGSEPVGVTSLVAVVSSVGNILDGQVQLNWVASVCDTNYPVLEYNIYQSSDNVSFSLVNTTSNLTFTISGLVNGSTYYFNVSATNAIGESPKVNISGIPLGLSTAPLNFTVAYDPTASTPSINGSANPAFHSVDLSFNVPSNEGGSAVSGFTVMYSLDASFATGVLTSVIALQTTPLQSNTIMVPYANFQTSTGWYFFKVAANNSLGVGNYSDITTIEAANMPVAIQSLTVANVNALGVNASGTCTLSWLYAIDSSIPLLGFICEYLDIHNNLVSVFVSDATPTPSYTIDHLQDGANYTFSVIALNMLGASPDVSISDVIPSTIPDAPTLSVVSGNMQNVLTVVSGYAHGAAITDTIFYKSTDNVNFNLLMDVLVSNGLSYTDTSLVNGTTYYYKATSINSNGASAYSAVISSVPSTIPAILPSCDIVVTNSNNASVGNQLTITVALNVDCLNLNGGNPINQIALYSLVAGANGWVPTQLESFTATAMITSYVFVDNTAVNGVTSTYGIRLFNANGYSQSAPFTGSPSGIPTSPTLVSVTNASLSASSLWVRISQNALSEGSAILNYNMYRNGVWLSAVSLANYDSFYDTSVILGVVYSYYATAVNANGESTQQNILSGFAHNLPDAPTGIMANSNMNSQTNVCWTLLNVVGTNGILTHPDDNADPLAGYIIRQNSTPQAAGAIVVTTTDDITTHHYNVTGLVNGNNYYFNVQAICVDGSYGQMSAFSSVVVPSDSPAVVQDVVISSNENTMYIDFAVPANDPSGHPSGGLAFQNHVTITDSSNVVQFDSGLTINTSFVVNTLINNAAYVVKIWCDNGINTDYNVYIYNTTVIPAPIVPSLAWNNVAANQIALTWNYQTQLYSATNFIIVAFSESQAFACSVVIDANIASAYSTISAPVSGVVSYTFLLNAASSSSTININDTLLVGLFVQNLAGVSPVSPYVVVNPPLGGGAGGGGN